MTQRRKKERKKRKSVLYQDQVVKAAGTPQRQRKARNPKVKKDQEVNPILPDHQGEGQVHLV